MIDDGTPVYEVVIIESRMITVRMVHTVLGGTEDSALLQAKSAIEKHWKDIDKDSFVTLGPLDEANVRY